MQQCLANWLGFVHFLQSSLKRKDVIVTLWEKWFTEETQASLKKITCDSYYELHRTFNQHRRQKDVTGIIGKVCVLVIVNTRNALTA